MPEFVRPESIEEAAALIETHGTALTVMGGGTGVLRAIYPSDGGYLLSTDRLGLDRIERHDGGWSVGAAVCLSALRAAVPLPAVAAATREVGGPAIQNMATIGGNLFSPRPFGDLAPALLAIGAELVFATPAGEERLAIEDFYAGWEGGAPSRPRLLTRVEIAEPRGGVSYLKCARRRFSSPSVVTVAAQVEKEGGSVARARIALSGASDRPFLSAGAEAAVLGTGLDDAALDAAAAAAEAEVSPESDAVATAWYRRRMAGVFVRRALAELAA